jgi:hypothetical protein
LGRVWQERRRERSGQPRLSEMIYKWGGVVYRLDLLACHTWWSSCAVPTREAVLVSRWHG